MSKIYFFDGELIEFEYPIRSLLDLGDKYIVLLHIPSGVIFPRNVYCLNKQGEVIWRIEDKYNFSAPYWSLTYNDDSLWLYTTDMFRRVDINSGEIIESKFVK